MSTYSFLDTAVTLTCADATLDLGYGAAVAAEGVEFAMGEDKNVMTMGADGEGMHTLICSNAGQVILRLLKTSPLNAKLSDLYNLQKSNTKKWGRNVISFTHAGSGDSGTAAKCAFKKRPALKYAKDADVVEWSFDSIKLEAKQGAYSE